MATESISHVERSVTVPGLKMIAAAADALDITVADVFAGLDDDRPLTTRRARLASSSPAMQTAIVISWNRFASIRASKSSSR